MSHRTSRAKTLAKWKPRMIALAHTVKQWSGCVDGKQHACILAVDGKYVVATGFNGVHRLCDSLPNCRRLASSKEDGCELYPNKCGAIHAEINAIINASRVGAEVRRCWAYLTKQPCEPCRAALINAGVTVIAWDERYKGAERPRADEVEVIDA